MSPGAGAAAAGRPVYLLAGSIREKRGRGGSALAQAIASAGKARPSVAYVGAASADSLPFRLLMSGFLKSAGAGEVLPVKLCGRRPDVAVARAMLDAADLVFVSGGDVEEGMRVLRDTGAEGHLQALAAQGKPFAGISAGSILLGGAWIRWRDPEDDASAELFPCLGIAPLSCDTHDEESGWAELRALVGLLPEGGEAWGIPSGGALVAGPGGSVTWEGPAPVRYRRVGEEVLCCCAEETRKISGARV